MNVAVILCYAGKNEKWLEQAIESIKSKEHSVDIFLHLDGCSLSPSFKFYNQCHIVKSDKRAGYANGINKLMLEAVKSSVRYDYIARMDDDDICLPERLDKQINFIESNNLDFCGTLISMIGPDGNMLTEKWMHQANNGKTWIQRFMEGGCHIANGTVIFKAYMLYDYGHIWYNPLYIVIEDYELWLRLLRQGYKYDVLPEHLYLYRLHPGQETQNHPMAARKTFITNQIHSFYKNNWENFLLI